MSKWIFCLITLIAPAFPCLALCGGWSEPEKIGDLEGSVIKEASGLAASSAISDRLYHVSDSGDGPYLYVTDSLGRKTQTVEIEGFNPIDVEDLTIGVCPQTSTTDCIYLADFGDNKRKRDYFSIVVLEELRHFPTKVKPFKILNFKYGDGPHDSEGVAFHPSGDLFIITKEFDHRLARSAIVFKISKEKLLAASGTMATLFKHSEIDLPHLLPAWDYSGQIVTSFDISTDGRKFILLTYKNAVEFSVNLSLPILTPSRQWVETVDFQVIPLETLPQQEALAFLPDGSGFLYDTEYHAPNSSLMKVSCLK